MDDNTALLRELVETAPPDASDKAAAIARFLQLREEIELSGKKLAALTYGLGNLMDQYPGIELKVDDLWKDKLRRLLDHRENFNLEALDRSEEVLGASRFGIKDEDGDLLRSPTVLEFKNGTRIPLKPGSQVRLHFTEGDYTLEGFVIQSKKEWDAPLIVLSEAPYRHDMRYFAVSLES